MRIFTSLITLIPLWISTVTAQCNFDPTCWQYSVGCALANAYPFERKTPMTCQECMDLCTKRRTGQTPYLCRGAVYDSTCNTCDIFAVQAQYPQRLTPSPGRIYFQPFGSGSCGGNNTGPVTPAPPVGNDCPSGQTAVIVAFKNSQSTAVSGGTPFPASSSDECLSFCQKNQDKSGNPAPCKTAQFASGQCTLSPNAPVANSQATLSNTDGSYYYEKQCFPTGTVGNCKTILMDPKHIIVGFNKKTVDAASYAECLQACLNSQAQNGFQCNSGQYFSDTTSLNCILNTETATTQPDKYLATQDQVTYFEPRCGSRALFALDSPPPKKGKKSSAKTLEDIPLEGGEWTLWSDCTPGKLERVRFRNCREKRIHNCPKETEPCDDNIIPDDTKFKIAKNNDIVRKDEGVPFAKFRPTTSSPSVKSQCLAMIDDQGNKRCDIGVRINNGVKKFCTPVDNC